MPKDFIFKKEAGSQRLHATRLLRSINGDAITFTFVELPPKAAVKHNPRVYDGKHITITVRNDGTYRPNFKPMREEDVLNLARYTHEVYVELCEGLAGLIEEG
ncbi:hypothetical protein [Prevotella sp. P6B4]|uniref:hypothetical protein n=1 Tax=Prevotella sp. P6B4 TaxID=1410614 RepID=UPI0018CC7B72|nr:hypothetical protein [Prevotella sp. P6B4]